MENLMTGVGGVGGSGGSGGSSSGGSGNISNNNTTTTPTPPTPPPISTGSSIRETQLALEREKLIKQESLKEERKLKSDKVQKEIAELRSSKSSATSESISPTTTTSTIAEKKQLLYGKNNNTSSASIDHSNNNNNEKKVKIVKKDKEKDKEKDANISVPKLATSLPEILPFKSSTPELSETKEESMPEELKSFDQITLEDPENFPLLILENCQIVDVEIGEITSNHHIVIGLDGKIQSMGPLQFIPTIKSWMRYDCQNMFILPGLCDGHTNITIPSESYPLLSRSSPSYIALSSSHILKSLLHSGFTTIRDTGGLDGGILQAITENLLDGPRILSSGMSLGPRGAFQNTSRYDPSNSNPITCCPHTIHCTRKCSSWCGWSVTQGEPQLRDFIHTLVQFHSISQLSIVCGNHCLDLNSISSPSSSSSSSTATAAAAALSSSTSTSLTTNGNSFTSHNNKEYPLLSKSEYVTISEECNLLSLPIMATCNTIPAIERALEMDGVRSIDGGLSLTSPLLTRMKEKGCALIPLLPSSLLTSLTSQGLSTSLSPQKQSQLSTNHPFSPLDEITTLSDEETFQKLFGSFLPNTPSSSSLHLNDFKQWVSLLSQATESNVSLVYGSNLHSNQYHRYTHTLLSLLASQLSPLQFLQSLTCNATKLFNLEEIIGTICVDAVADLIMIPSNPLLDKKWCDSEDSICAVIQRGRIKKLLRPYRESLYLLDEDTQEVTPMVTQETIGKKFNYMSNSNANKKRPWKPPGPLQPNLASPTIQNNSNQQQSNNNSSNTSTHGHGHASPLVQRSLSSIL